MITRKFLAEGTTCESCAEIIRKQALEVEGVKEIEFDYSTEKGHVVFDENLTDIDTILYKIEEKGYECFILSDADKKSWGVVVGIVGIVVIGYFLSGILESVAFPKIGANMGYGLLFLVGLLTGLHCVSMCGGFVLSYTAKDAQEGRLSHKSHIMYGLGKTISYTMIGAVFGLIGSIVAFTPLMRGVAGLLAGSFLVLFGLKMLNVIPGLRKLSVPMPRSVSKFLGEKSSGSSPLVIGLLNGLMIACGPLQAIYIMAAGTGNMLEGAKLLFVFAIGTLPVMLGFGYIASYLSNKMTHKILKASGVMVIILGLLMINNGLALTGTGYDANSILASVSAAGDSVVVAGGVQQIRMEVNRYGWSPDKFVLKKGVPVKWIINGKEINSCNNAIQVPKLGLRFDIKPGEQTIEFTPDQEGVIPFSCWMGMIPGTFIVKDDINVNDNAAVQKELAQVPQQQVGSCGGSCGSPSCGAANGGGCGCRR